MQSFGIGSIGFSSFLDMLGSFVSVSVWLFEIFSYNIRHHIPAYGNRLRYDTG